MLAELAHKRVLLLQGPMGPFFARLARDLRALGAEPLKINFNSGDALFYQGAGVFSFRGTLDEWPGWLETFIQDHSIDAVVLFGDGRPYHRRACELAITLGKGVHVFEEGYLRPNFITLEREGVNGYSTMSRDPDFYLSAPASTVPDELPLGHVFSYMAFQSAMYVLAMWAGARFYPHYQHHRTLHPAREAAYWLRGGLRKLLYRIRERRISRLLYTRWSGQFFLVPLQVHNDHQLKHSPFPNVESFIREVVGSFARRASSDKALVIKHHPMDRGYSDYTSLLHKLARKHHLVGRVFYIHDQHLPTLLKHACGVVTINSTVGMSAIHHGTPVKLLGKAIYDIPGLTHQGALRSFWHDPKPADRELWDAFRRWLLAYNQANGSFYKRLSGDDRGTTVRWLTTRIETPAAADGAKAHSLRAIS